MPQFRKKPVVIEAVQYAGEVTPELQALFGEVAIKSKRSKLVIETLEGDMVADVGDWVIKGVKGELYPCKPDIFDATYEPADAASPAAIAHRREYRADELERMERLGIKP